MDLNSKSVEEKIRQYRVFKSCSQSTLMGLCEVANHPMSQARLCALASGFSGGIGGTFDEGTCGALTGALIALGFLEDDEILIMVGQIRDNIKLPLNIINIKKIEDLNELSEIYAAANVIMNLSYQKTFGMTTVEGFACGTPSIVYNCTASPELITFNTGYVVSPGDFIGIRKALDKIKLNKPEFYSVNCRKRAVDFYNKNDRYNEYFSIYEKKKKK